MRGSRRTTLFTAALGLTLVQALTSGVGGPARAQQVVKVDGSTGVAPLVAALAQVYQLKEPGVSIQIGRGLGTKARLEALASSAIDIAMASHGLKVDEITRQGMAVVQVASTPVVFAVNASVPVTGLSDAQVCGIYAGERTNWKELGGPDLAIAPRTRPDTEVDAEVVRDGLPCLKNLKMTDAVKVMPRSGDMAAELAATPGAFGMTTATVVEQSGGKIRAVAYNGVSPDEAQVTAGRYKLTREAYLVTRTPPAQAAAKFLDFVRGPEGAAVIRANGAIPKVR